VSRHPCRADNTGTEYLPKMPSDQRICTPEMARLITSRWISEVPSKIV
jgi:hypothetical protein